MAFQDKEHPFSHVEATWGQGRGDVIPTGSESPSEEFLTTISAKDRKGSRGLSKAECSRWHILSGSPASCHQPTKPDRLQVLLRPDSMGHTETCKHVQCKVWRSRCLFGSAWLRCYCFAGNKLAPHHTNILTLKETGRAERQDPLAPGINEPAGVVEVCDGHMAGHACPWHEDWYRGHSTR